MNASVPTILKTTATESTTFFRWQNVCPRFECNVHDLSDRKLLAIRKIRDLRAARQQWSWWRVLLPFWAVLGNNHLYITVGFAWLFFADAGATEEAVTIRQGHGAYGYQIGR